MTPLEYPQRYPYLEVPVEDEQGIKNRAKLKLPAAESGWTV